MTDRRSSPSPSHPPRSGPPPEDSRQGSGPRRGLVTVEVDDRGQTVQDFAIGASVFLLTITFVFGFLPTLFTPFEEEVSPGLQSQVDRVAAGVVDNGSTDGRPNWMSESSAEDAIAPGSGSDDDLQQAYGLPRTSQVNVTLRPLDAEGQDPPVDADLSGGDNYQGQPAATVSRIVVVKGVPECDPTTNPDAGQACRLTVRVW